MTQILARSVAKSLCALFATTALVAVPAGASAAARLQPAVATSADVQPELILAATHKKKHTAAKATSHKASGHKKATHHRKGHHAAAAAPADEAADAAPSSPGANGRVIEVAAGGESYTVKKGDTLGKVADKLGLDVAELKRANKLRGNAIKPGQVLKAPGTQSKIYVAARGDTVAGVAKRFGVTEAKLRSENGFGRKTASVRSGAHLVLPEGWRDHAEAAPSPSRARAKAKTAIAEDDTNLATETLGRSVNGRLIDVPGPGRSYRVRKGDTLEKVADKLDVSVATLKRENHLKKTRLRPGQVLKAPGGGTVKAYVVGPGDTTYSIAKRFGVTIEALRAANGMGRRGTIHTGEKLRLPSGWRDHGVVSTTPERPTERIAPTRPQTTNPPSEDAPVYRPSAPQPYTPSPLTPHATTPPAITNGPPIAPTGAPPPTDAQISELGRGKFLWPVRGVVLSEFGPKTAGQRNDGINIQAEAGDPVRAAAAGDVVYAGDQVPGFGNLVLLKHPDGWVTAYGHLSKVEVKMQQKVSQGQEIGQAGQTGGVAEPQVHFEVRYAPNPLDRARPVDPKLVLPR